MIRDFLVEWTHTAESCGRLALSFIEHGEPDRAYSAAMTAFHFAGLKWEWRRVLNSNEEIH